MWVTKVDQMCNTYIYGLSFIDIKTSNMIKMIVSLFNEIPSHFVYHTLTDINIM
jgi:hypothetical protein